MILVMGGLSLQPIFADSELPPVYQQSQLILDKSGYTYGDTITVTVISPLNNTDPTISDTIMTPLDATYDPNRNQTYLAGRTLTENGPDTGIFVGKFQIVKPGDKPSENESVDGYLEVSPDSDYIAVMLKRVLEDISSGLVVQFTYADDPTPPNAFINSTISAYPNAQFRWKESISPREEIGIMRVEYPSQNISDEID